MTVPPSDPPRPDDLDLPTAAPATPLLLGPPVAAAQPPASQALTVPEPLKTSGPPLRVVAVTEAGVPLTRTYARLVQALRDQGVEVLPLAVPREPPRPEAVPTINELKRGLASFAKDLMRGFRNEPAPGTWLASQLRAVEGRVDAVLVTDAEMGRHVLPTAAEVWPHSLRLGVDGDYDVDEAWKALELDALVVPHPGLGSDLPRVREQRTRIAVGGPIVAGAEIEPKHLDPSLPQVVVSFARLDPGDVDPLLFQLSLAHPERFSLLFLPSSRPGIDELVRARAPGYGLKGKRPKDGAEVEPWIRGAALLVGHPSPTEAATAAAARVPLLFFSPEGRISDGDRFLLRHGAALHAEVPITIAVHVEGLLPGGTARERAELGLADLEGTGTIGAARAVVEAIRAGRTEPVQGPSAAPASSVDTDLEDIGEVAPAASPAGQAPTADVSLQVRRAYLKEIILQQQTIERQLGKARSGLDTWQRRVRLARSANDDTLADRAVPRVEGLIKLVDRLERELAELQGLRERFASRAPLTAADRHAAARFMNPSAAATLDRGEAPDSAFTRLELEDALAVLKRKLGDLK
ncbi:MAG: hypothetical protein IT385_07735 [Deltaproteobacteria bacterium]|nr:hypothetical protein [Deltaproteobacteria bacterium]